MRGQIICQSYLHNSKHVLIFAWNFCHIGDVLCVIFWLAFIFTMAWMVIGMLSLQKLFSSLREGSCIQLWPSGLLPKRLLQGWRLSKCHVAAPAWQPGWFQEHVKHGTCPAVFGQSHVTGERHLHFCSREGHLHQGSPQNLHCDHRGHQGGDCTPEEGLIFGPYLRATGWVCFI